METAEKMDAGPRNVQDVCLCVIGRNVYPDGTEATSIVYCPLHAAAPEMLAALRDLVARFPEGQYEGAFSKVVRAVIRKAEG